MRSIGPFSTCRCTGQIHNERDGGIHGVPLVWEECDILFPDIASGVACYERLKTHGATGAAVFHPLSTPLIYALTKRVAQDQIPLLTVGIGRADAADGRVFPYIFPVPSTWWSQNTAKIRFLGQRVGSLEQLQGLKIAHVYHDTANSLVSLVGDVGQSPSPVTRTR